MTSQLTPQQETKWREAFQRLLAGDSAPILRLMKSPASTPDLFWFWLRHLLDEQPRLDGTRMFGDLTLKVAKVDGRRARPITDEHRVAIKIVRDRLSEGANLSEATKEAAAKTGMSARTVLRHVERLMPAPMSATRKVPFGLTPQFFAAFDDARAAGASEKDADESATKTVKSLAKARRAKYRASKE